MGKDRLHTSTPQQPCLHRLSLFSVAVEPGSPTTAVSVAPAASSPPAAETEQEAEAVAQAQRIAQAAKRRRGKKPYKHLIDKQTELSAAP
jgi:hypothetical protein